MSSSLEHRKPTAVADVARGFLVEADLADAVLLLEANADRGELMDPAARDLCERAAVDIRDRAAVAELLGALANRLAELDSTRADAFQDALAAFPEEERFGVPALATVLWPTLENLHRAGTTDPARFQAAVARHKPALLALHRRGSGRDDRAFELAWATLHGRLPILFARHAAFLDRAPRTPLRELLQTPEGIGVITGALGLLTLRMAVPTPLVCGVLALVGYAGIAPVMERLRDGVHRMVMDALAEEDAVIRRAERFPSLALTDVLEALRPTLFTAHLAGATTQEQLRAHLQPLLDELRQACRAPGAPGDAYADAVEDVVFQKYAPSLVQVAEHARLQVEAGLAGRVMSDPHTAGIVVAAATVPVSFAVARVTPWGIWDMPLMVALFYAAARVITDVRSPRRRLQDLRTAMAAEEKLLAGLYGGGT